MEQNGEEILDTGDSARPIPKAVPRLSVDFVSQIPPDFRDEKDFLIVSKVGLTVFLNLLEQKIQMRKEPEETARSLQNIARFLDLPNWSNNGYLGMSNLVEDIRSAIAKMPESPNE